MEVWIAAALLLSALFGILLLALKKDRTKAQHLALAIFSLLSLLLAFYLVLTALLLGGIA